MVKVDQLNKQLAEQENILIIVAFFMWHTFMSEH